MDAGFETERQDGPPVRFYASNQLLLDGAGQRLFSMRYGGANGWPFVESKGPASVVVASVLRRHFLDCHAPSRIDSAYDLRGPEAFADLHRIALATQERGIRLDYAGAAVDHPDRGTTIYLGGRKSQSFVRGYQKGLKLAEEMGLAPDDIPDELRHWVRIELELKPDKQKAKQAARNLTPAGVWGCSPWIRRFAREALSIDAERVTMREKRESNHERAMRYLMTQYRSHLIEEAKRCGGWSELGLSLGERCIEPEAAF